MGILDQLSSIADDPAKSQGLLQMGLSLLASKGSFASALGNAGMAGIQGAQNYRQQDFQRKLQADQLAQMQRQKQMQNLPQQFVRAPSAPGVDATGGMDTASENPNNAYSPQGSFDSTGYANALQGFDPMQSLQYKAAMAKPGSEFGTEPRYDQQNRAYVVAKDGTLKYLNGVNAPPQKQAEYTPSTVEKLIAARDALPRGHPNRKIFDQAIQKESSHTPQVSIANYGSPVPYELPGGGVGYVQPANKPGAPPVVMNDPSTGVPFRKPPEQKNLPVDFTKSVAGLQELGNGLDSYEKTLKANNGQSMVATGKRRAALQGAYTSLQMGLKNAFELGEP